MVFPTDWISINNCSLSKIIHRQLLNFEWKLFHEVKIENRKNFNNPPGHFDVAIETSASMLKIKTKRGKC